MLIKKIEKNKEGTIVFKRLYEIFIKYKKIFHITNVKKKQYFFVIFLTFITVALDAIGIGMLLPIGEYVLNYQKGEIPDTAAWKILKIIFSYIGLKPNIILIVSSIILIIIFRQIVTFFKVILTDIIKFNAIKNLRQKLFFKFLKRDVFFMKKQNTGLYNNIINNETEVIGNAIILPLDNITGVILITSYLVLMMFISLKATLVVIVCIFLIAILLKQFLIYIKSLSSKIIQINNKFSQNMVDRLMAFKFIRLTNMMQKEELFNKKIVIEQYFNNIKLARIQKLIDTSIEPLLLMIAIPIISLAIMFNFPLAKLGVFIILLARFIPAFKTTITGIQNQASYFASISNMINIISKIDSQKEIRRGSNTSIFNIKSIEFKNIYFNYEDGNTSVLKNFSGKIIGGKINALVGASGTGKTTLINMIPRLIEPQAGIIKVNKIDLSTIEVNTIRNLCVFIEQKPSFIRGTILQHITYNTSDISLKKAQQAAKLANANEFILNLPDKYSHKLGESGTGLSGGQLQRLDISRGIASEKPLMILDEPTSNLDINNTHEIFTTLQNINKNKNTTIIVVTHDSTVLKYCDIIIKF
ncbi:ABC transporter ATP-binding protein/permease [Pelagibacteraceae bacterium]|nr:ABC transporter ATP-binding protein/permease [Pelagibacteraceae bacterium]